MDMEENITYNFSDSANGIFRDIKLKNDTDIRDNLSSMNNADSIENIQVYEVLKDGSRKKYSEGSGKNGDTGIYEIKKEEDKLRIKIYSKTKGENKNFIIKYKLFGAIVNYSDTVQLYWNFIGSSWETDLNNVLINIYLPENGGDKIKVYPHGPLSGNYKVFDGRKIEFKVDKVPSGTSVDGRILFPNSVVKNNKKISDEKILAKVDEIKSS